AGGARVPRTREYHQRCRKKRKCPIIESPNIHTSLKKSSHDSPYSETAHQRPDKPHAKSSHRGSRRRGRKKGPAKVHMELTSHPTSRNAYADTRAWLLKQHGPTCAYCGARFTARVMTLDHVAPRRGQSAFDRRDNLVLCCRACNMLK